MIRLYNKLVRDGMPEIIAQDGNRAAFGHLCGASLDTAVTSKVLEEAIEFAESGSAEELADLLAIVTKAAERFGGLAVIEGLAEAKKGRRGGFDSNLLLLFAEGDNLP